MGGLGYFPTYTLGNLYSAQLMHAARNDLPGLDDDFLQGQFTRLKHWLNDKIHQGTLQHLDVGICGPSTTKQFGPLMIRVTVDPGDDEIAFGTVPAA